jgi:2-polyprenyl-6-methoxyphenol hydroxylase-like FAD-dependent oxidoreductase
MFSMNSVAASYKRPLLWTLAAIGAVAGSYIIIVALRALRSSLPPNLPANSLGVQAAEDLRTFQIRLNDEEGTPGVNRRGSDLADAKYVEERILSVRQHVLPHAHTVDSYARFRGRIRQITISSIHSGSGYGRTPVEVKEMHHHFKEAQIKNFGKQLKVAIVGAGPIGLSASLMFYKSGFQVECYERYSEADNQFAARRQPFSLERQAYHFLSSLGVVKTKVFEEFGNLESVQEQAKKRLEPEPLMAAAMITIAEPVMREAKIKRIGEHAGEYVPNNISLPIATIQKLLYGTTRELDDADELKLFFGHLCEQTESDADGRYTLIFKNSSTQETRAVNPDFIFDASGGKISESLGFENEKVATYYGMGAFYDPPQNPKPKDEPPRLTRAVRPFCSFKQEEPIYCGIELTQAEFQTNGAENGVAAIVAEDLGLSKPREAFKVEIALKQVKQAAYSSQLKEGQLPQLRMTGGDSTLTPHFLTASGANFGLLGLIELEDIILYRLINQKPEWQQALDKYNSLATLLQKQSCQMVVNFFGRELIPQ